MAGLSGDVDIPKVGRLPKVAVLGGVGAVIVLIIYEKKKQSAAARSAAAAATSDPYPPDGSTGNPSDPNSTDPSTGATYGNEESGYAAAAGGLGDLYGTGYGGYGSYGGSPYGSGDAYPWDGTYGNPNDPYSMDTGSGQTYGNEGNYGTGNSGNTGGPPFSTNAQWSQYVLNYFTQNQFGDISGMTTALGLYLAGQEVNSTQQGYINDAIAIGGKPPVSGPGNFPPSIRTTGSQGGTVTVPNEKGKTAGTAHNDLIAAGLVPTADPGQQASWIVSSTSPAPGRKVQKGALVLITAAAGSSGDVTVPNEAGKSAGTAHNDLVHAGLVPVAPPAQRPGMRVSHTRPGAGSRVPRGTHVTIATSGYVK